MKINNFDLLRHLLAFSVVWHHFNILGGYGYSFSLLDVVNSDVAVKAFFVISGLLVWTSANRTSSWRSYFVKRSLRIYPALLAILLISVMISLFVFQESLVNVTKYLFWNSIFLSFLNPCIGSVFDGNVLCAVNGSLWTLKLEVSYYVFVGFSVYKFKEYAYRLIVLFSMLSFLLETILYSLPSYYSDVVAILHNQIPFKFYYFGMGVIFYRYHEKCSMLVLFLFLLVSFSGWYLLKIDFIFLPLFVLLFVYIAAFRFPVIKLSKFGDLSYGMYIFHFPIIQLFVYKGWLVNGFYVDFLTVLSLVLLLSKVSWEFLESKAINLSKRMDRKVVSFRPAAPVD